MSTDERRAIVRVDTLLAIEPFQSDEDTRYYLKGANIEPHPEGGAVLVATDGHAMAAIHEAEGYVSGLPAVWDHQARTRLKPMMAAWRKSPLQHPLWCDLRTDTAKTSSISVHRAETVQQILDGEAELLVSIPDKVWIDGSFPEWRRVFRANEIPDRLPHPLPINRVLLRQLCDLASGLADTRTSVLGMSFYPSPNDGPTRAVINGHPEIAILLMPYREEKITPANITPPWLRTLLTPPETDADATEAVAKAA